MFFRIEMIKYFILSVLSISSVVAQYTNCDYLQNLNPGQVYDVFSPGYPNQPYFSGTNCRWRALAPFNYQIRLNCYDMRLPQNNCLDRLEMSWTGIYNDPNPTYACTGQTFTYTTGNQLVIALRSQSTGTVFGAGTGYFRCQVVAQLNSGAGSGISSGVSNGNGITGTNIGTSNVGK